MHFSVHFVLEVHKNCLFVMVFAVRLSVTIMTQERSKQHVMSMHIEEIMAGLLHLWRGEEPLKLPGGVISL